MSFLANRSPISSSTPGGIESGVLPSLEGRFVVAEKGRRGVVCAVWKAGTRKLGSVAVGEGAAAAALCRACLPILGASIVWVVADWPCNSRHTLRLSSATEWRSQKRSGGQHRLLQVGLGLVSTGVLALRPIPWGIPSQHQGHHKHRSFDITKHKVSLFGSCLTQPDHRVQDCQNLLSIPSPSVLFMGVRLGCHTSPSPIFTSIFGQGAMTTIEDATSS